MAEFTKGLSLDQLWTESQGSGLYLQDHTDVRLVQLAVQAGISERKVFKCLMMVLVVSDTEKRYFEGTEYFVFYYLQLVMEAERGLAEGCSL